MSTPQEIKNRIEREQRLANYAGPNRIVSGKELYETVERMRKERGAMRLIKSGIPRLDSLIYGFYEGDVTVLSGKTKNGKTLFAETLTQNFFNQAVKTLWFAYESVPERFLEKFDRHMAEEFLIGPLELKGINATNLADRITEAKLKFPGMGAVIIDNLSFIINMDSHNLSLEIGKIMQMLKGLAKELRVTIFLLAHMAKDRLDAEPDNDSIRDSSFISQLADNVFFIWRRKSNPQQAVLKISANRYPGIMNEKVNLIKPGGSNFLQEIDERYADDE